MIINLFAAAELPLACLAATLSLVLAPARQRPQPVLLRIDGRGLANIIRERKRPHEGLNL
jgi:hypothetical protein